MIQLLDWEHSGAPAVPDRDTAILAELDAIQQQDEWEDE